MVSRATHHDRNERNPYTRATRIELLPGLNEVSVLGDITWRPGEPANIERLRLRGDATVPVGTAPREQVLARGKWDGESLATMIAADLTFRFTRHTGKVVLETLVSGTLLDGNMMACGLSVKGGTNTAPKGTRRLPVWMSGE